MPTLGGGPPGGLQPRLWVVGAASLVSLPLFLRRGLESAARAGLGRGFAGRVAEARPVSLRGYDTET